MSVLFFFKCTNQPPVGRFATYEGLPSDHYLRLAGLGGRLLRGEQVSFPDVAPDPAQQTYRPLSQLEIYKEESPFSSESVARWQSWFKGVSIPLHAEPYSEWIRDLYNGNVLDIEPEDWGALLNRKEDLPLVVVGTGGEGFNEGKTPVEDIVAHLQGHLSRGGVLLVVAGGAYPMYYPDKSERAAQFGFRLELVNVPRNSTIAFAEALSSDLGVWEVGRAKGSRLMRASLYPDAMSYQALASVTHADGQYGGDAIASVQPGGELGTGRIIYVASALLEHPDREKVLESILRYVHEALPVR